ncbi:MAG TPA: hypothetical protein VL882_05535 [Vicinamibacterales bacterium]|nr:hypothetical protein [Vicinamibacterales bacterium]
MEVQAQELESVPVSAPGSAPALALVASAARALEPDSAREPVRLRRHPPGPMVWWSAQ